MLPPSRRGSSVLSPPRCVSVPSFSFCIAEEQRQCVCYLLQMQNQTSGSYAGHTDFLTLVRSWTICKSPSFCLFTWLSIQQVHHVSLPPSCFIWPLLSTQCEDGPFTGWCRETQEPQRVTQQAPAPGIQAPRPVVLGLQQVQRRWLATETVLFGKAGEVKCPVKSPRAS